MNIMKILLNQSLRNQENYCSVHIGDEVPCEYLRWISYIPDKWNVSELLKKDTVDLSEEEVAILKRVKMEAKYKAIFERYLFSEKKLTQDVYDVYMFTKSISIGEYAEMKLTESELVYCNNMVREYSKLSREELDKVVFSLGENMNRNMCEEFILYKLKKVRSDKDLVRMEGEISSLVERNRVMSLKSVEYAKKSFCKK